MFSRHNCESTAKKEDLYFFKWTFYDNNQIEIMFFVIMFFAFKIIVSFFFVKKMPPANNKASITWKALKKNNKNKVNLNRSKLSVFPLQ